MNDILGYDIDGTPIRSGSICLVVADNVSPSFNGQVVTALKRATNWPEAVCVDLVPAGSEAPPGSWCCYSKSLRALPKARVDRSAKELIGEMA